ncbi:Efflux pump protein; FarA (modular protein) [Mesorhizobium metallidurans STM 2683]|uniref:Efflux pump protein FarA (Modular protein) n=1 Tax=Mesorhizobium metallidurans STM 2683 TaxID=1297569 RepID=M5EP90_9HYPH|nr:Efflux pump protein; FarA (modular protein) [Mesorhizobium metallidurans STM 2683]
MRKAQQHERGSQDRRECGRTGDGSSRTAGGKPRGGRSAGSTGAGGAQEGAPPWPFPADGRAACSACHRWRLRLGDRRPLPGDRERQSPAGQGVDRLDTAGRIAQVDIADNQLVKQGDVLFAIDPEPYRIALAQADAAVAGARLNVEQLRAAYSQAVAQEKSDTSEVGYAQSQYDRAADLARKGINAKSALDEARNDLDKAKQQLAVAQQGIVSARAALGGNPDIETDKHPTVMAALAARDKAAYDLAQTTIKAPADGVISQASSFKVGQYVGWGTPLFSLVETDDTWIDANFKETQLTHMKPGQKAEIVVDTYPGRTFEATVKAIGAGTGAEFSLLPAQNATGNWVKVTQRIPVRLELTNADAKMALRTGMSATVTVDTGVARGFPNIFGHATAGEH